MPDRANHPAPIARADSAADTAGMGTLLTPSHESKRVFVVEDSPIVRERLIDMLGHLPNVEVVGEAERPVDAIEGITRTVPDVVLLDVHLIDGSGMDVLRAVHPHMPDVAFVVLTNYTEPIYRNAYMKAGAQFYLDKSHEFNDVPGIVASLHATHANGA